MKVDSLDELRSAFAEWWRRKKHAREAMPEELLARARLFLSRPAVRKAPHEKTKGGEPKSVATFSRLELSAPSAPSARPIAEMETGSGVKLRMFEQTPELMGLLSAVCGLGNIR